MDKMQPICMATTSTPGSSAKSDYVVKRLDQLEEIGKYSVIYEITRIETMITLKIDWLMAEPA